MSQGATSYTVLAALPPPADDRAGRLAPLRSDSPPSRDLRGAQADARRATTVHGSTPCESAMGCAGQPSSLTPSDPSQLSGTPEELVVGHPASTSRHVDQDMQLPPGCTCADCGHFGFCSDVIQVAADWTACDYAPSRFVLAVPDETGMAEVMEDEIRRARDAGGC